MSPRTVTKKCRLCGDQNELISSHIFPKFIFNWMKETGSGFIRRVEAPNIRLQDGVKKYLLCQNCEKIFSKVETYFSKEIFYQYLNQDKRQFRYDNRLMNFLVSILWRILTLELPECSKEKHLFLSNLLQAENQWRKFLLGQNNLSKYSEIHLFLTDLIADNTQPVQGLNQYLNRVIDGTIVSSREICYVYAKFSRFIIFGFLTPYNRTLWVNTKITNGHGILKTPQSIRDGSIGNFFADRSRIVWETYEKGISKNQKELITEHFKKNAQKIILSDFGMALGTDYSATIDPSVIWKKVGRNEKCPCGSGKKYKHCHGK